MKILINFNNKIKNEGRIISINAQDYHNYYNKHRLCKQFYLQTYY